MDIARTKKPRSKTSWIVGAALSAILGAALLSSMALGPAVPAVERKSLVLARVERGAFVSSVHGPGTLVPRDLRWISSDSAARVERVVVKPGASVQPDTVILELSN